MSDAITALGGARFDGGIATISEATRQGMITLRGDLSHVALKNAATGIAAVDMPDPRKAHVEQDRGILWMSPDELLVLCPYDEVPGAMAKLASTQGGTHALAVNVSDARALFHVGGPRAREVLAKLCPVDFSPEAFGPGTFRRTRMAQVAAGIWMERADEFYVMCFRSVAQYVFDVLCVAAQEGSEVGYFPDSRVP
ncbi:sarcosine oxidase subunit gamma family protein [Sulfitobacter sp. LCG007]